MAKLLALQLASLCVCLSLVAAYEKFQKEIPNGNRVTNPCQPEQAWIGVGHNNPGGKGVRNPFGRDFNAKDFSWKEVCKLDSDGDGRTNGEELGDPKCEWKKGDPSPEGEVTHPGVCEPLESADCKERNSWLDCTKFKLNCPAINEEDVKKITLRLPPTAVPPNETTYMCYATALPQDDDYHIIATTPIVNNTFLLHHVLLYLCADLEDPEILNGTKECFMDFNDKCGLVGIWGVGSTGQCFLDSYGFPIGKNAFKYAYMEVHWNNPELNQNLIDSSGMTLYYTNKLRPNNALIVMTGQSILALPPKRDSVIVDASCPDFCTKSLQPLFITWATIHMHLQGKAGKVELYRGGKPYRVLIDEPFDYNSPPESEFREPIQFLPGDEIKTTCEYQTLNRDNVTYNGESTSTEMCYAFISYFPAQPDFTGCYNALAPRMTYVCTSYTSTCNYAEFIKLVPASKECDGFLECTEHCKGLLKEINDTGCLEGDDGRFNDGLFAEGEREQMRKMVDCVPSGASSSKKSEQILFLIVSICAVCRLRFLW